MHWHSKAIEDETRAAASFPLLRGGQEPIGILLFLAPEENTFTPDLVELLGRLAENVSFALDNFDRAEEKARTEAQKERLTRMFAALSATNEAIMRAKSRAELFDLVCLAASNGAKFTSTTIALAEGRQRPAARSSPAPGPSVRHHAQPSVSPSIPNRPGGPRDERHGVPHAPALHQQRLSQPTIASAPSTPSSARRRAARARRSRWSRTTRPSAS